MGRGPDPERQVGRVDQVRYVVGAPEEWAEWLRPGDTVSLISLGGGIAVENPSGRGFLPMKSLQRIDLEDPIASAQRQDSGFDWGKMTFGLMNMGALEALPRRALGVLTITAGDQVIEFDVSRRTWPEEALVTPEAESSLIRKGESMVRIRDGSYRWIVVKRFVIPRAEPRAAVDALGVLIGHPAYWDDYLGGNGITPHIHGPYRLDAISPEEFRSSDATRAMATLEHWLHRGGHVADDQLDGNLPDVHRLINEADTCYQLPDLGEAAHNDIGFILDEPFIEFVLVGPEDRLVLIVASGD